MAAIGFTGLAVIVWLLLSGPRMENQPSVRSYETEMPLPPEFSIPYIPAKTTAYDSLLLSSDITNLQRGRIYYGYYCVFCHGDDGRGNGPVGISYFPKPADLTNARIQGLSYSDLYRISFTGNGHAPVLEKVVTEEHKKHIIYYVMEGIPN